MFRKVHEQIIIYHHVFPMSRNPIFLLISRYFAFRKEFVWRITIEAKFDFRSNIGFSLKSILEANI